MLHKTNIWHLFSSLSLFCFRFIYLYIPTTSASGDCFFFFCISFAFACNDEWWCRYNNNNIYKSILICAHSCYRHIPESMINWLNSYIILNKRYIYRTCLESRIPYVYAPHCANWNKTIYNCLSAYRTKLNYSSAISYVSLINTWTVWLLLCCWRSRIVVVTLRQQKSALSWLYTLSRQGRYKLLLYHHTALCKRVCVCI